MLTYVSEPGHKLSPMAQELYYGRTGSSSVYERHVVTLRAALELDRHRS